MPLKTKIKNGEDDAGPDGERTDRIRAGPHSQNQERSIGTRAAGAQRSERAE